MSGETPAPAAAAAPPRVTENTAGPRRWGDLWPRLASGLVMIALALSTATAGGWIFAAFWLLASLAILWEWQRMIGVERLGPRLLIGIVAILSCAALAVMGYGQHAAILAVIDVVALAVVAIPGRRVLAAGGLAYAGALAVAVIVLRRSDPNGLAAIVWLFAVVWGTDVMAYFGGRLVGGPKLWPRLSPSKTWSGFLIGICAGACAGLAVAPARGIAVFVAGLAAGAVAQGGDLFESSLKRRFGVKDASHLIPGHGGVMDRLDGFLAAAVCMTGLGVARAGLDAAGQGLFNWP